jgi:DNA-binding transcriptional regulator/RsmH inhibitor MraZ
MGKIKKSDKRIIELDERGRITLPKQLREGVSSYAVEPQADGSLNLIPQKTVSMREADLLETLKKSIAEFKSGNTKKLPPDWID